MFPDWIAIGAVNNVAEVASIDYMTNTITLASPKSWNAGAPVYLYRNSGGGTVLRGGAPDIGAFEYAAGPPRAPVNVEVR